MTLYGPSGSDMVEAQRSGIHIVTSPYRIHFTHTPKFFKPGMPFDMTVYVTNPDDSPAPRIPVMADNFQGLVSTQWDGKAKLVLNMPANRNSVPITVRTAQKDLPPERQASQQMVAEAYRSQGNSGNYLHLAVGSSQVQPGDNLPINFHLKSNRDDVRKSVSYFTYLILSKGHIVHVGRQPREGDQSLVTMSLPVTPNLIPSFRIVAYYHVKPGEIVADSVWVDVKDTCMGSLVVKGASEADNRVLEPRTSMKLRIEGDHKAHVGLVAVDKAVYVLSKDKLTQKKVWDTVEAGDIGCTPGSGRDHVGVFADTGLSLTSNVNIRTEQRGDLHCPKAAERRRRSVKLIKHKGTKMSEYSDKNQRKCCEDGMKDNLMGYSCEKRATYIMDGSSCVEAFLDCCLYIKGIREEERELQYELARSNISTKTLPVYLKDSITTWEVLAISLSEKKALNVGLFPLQPEGMRLEKTVKIVELDPKNFGNNGVQVVKVEAANLSDIVPNTESETKVSIQGNPVSILVEKAIDGTKLKHLIVTPSGCGEQNMIGMTPTVIAVHYLDSTMQWETFGIHRRTEAIELIKKGYTQQLAFRKEDGSFAAFNNRPSSTWLTAYVAKVFAMAINMVDIKPEVICGAIKWLILEKQKPDGLFQEDAPVIHKEMLGGYHGAEPEVSLTAFVLTALQESQKICKNYVKSLDGSIAKASEYLTRKYQALARPYTVALSSYALALTGKLNSERELMKFSKDGSHWAERDAHTYNIEGTSYALLALLQMEKTELTGPVVRWLAQQNYFGGGYGSTQATILVFQALAQYHVAVPRQQELNLDVSVLLPRRANAVTYRIENSNALVARSAETKLNEDFTVKAEGTGKGTMTVVTVYNAKVPDSDSKCDNFDLRVNVEDVRTGQCLHVPPCPSMSLHVPLCPSMSLHVPPCPSMSLHVPPCPSMSLHVPPCPSMFLHVPPCPSMSLHVPPCPFVTLHVPPCPSVILHVPPCPSMSLHVPL
uniref:Complement C3 n=1 Tax=Coturnix japonica TaxID=93934 RepID=A0A8C2SU29_COTJA